MCGVIQHALELRPALNNMLSQSKYSKGKAKLSHLKLSCTEWDLLEQLLPMLQVSIHMLSVWTSLILSLGLRAIHKAYV